MSMKVCHISSAHPAEDARIYLKQCRSLAKHFETYLAIPHDGDVVKDGVNIVGLKKYPSRLKRFIIAPFKAMKRALSTKSEIYQLHDPELIFIGFLLKLMGKKVIMDYHELVYDQLKDKAYLGSFSKHIIRSVYLFLERRVVANFDAILLAEDSYIKHFEKHHSKYKSKFHFIRNYPITALIQAQEQIPLTDEKFKLFYVGSISHVRGLKEITQAVNQIDEDVSLYIIGKWGSQNYLNEVKAEDKKGRLNLIDFVPPTEVYGYLRNADLGMCVLYPIDNYLESLPVKSYEYMSLGIPMVMSNFPLWMEKYADSAVFIDPLNVDAIAKTLTEALKDKARLKEMGLKGKADVEANYSWENEAQTLVNLYRSLS